MYSYKIFNFNFIHYLVLQAGWLNAYYEYEIDAASAEGFQKILFK